ICLPLMYIWVTCVIDIFFFQAEDGIRDRNVTGVQTCALPIFPLTISVIPVSNTGQNCILLLHQSDKHILLFQNTPDDGNFGFQRSEERRVGKECMCGWLRWMSKERRWR